VGVSVGVERRYLPAREDPVRTSKLILATLIAVVLGSTGCVSKTATQGVQNRWRGTEAPKFQPGSTTQQDVLTRLGPPSQLIQVGERTVFYYLRERMQERGAILLVYNRTVEDVTYDRAIFFFDDRGLLTESALSHEVIPTD
jgi:outer membrane protein assembly factor BamE (lipoprotein component of BamABCDE complex)